MHEVFGTLLLLVGDKPDEDAALPDALEEAVLGQMGTLHEAKKAARHALNAVGHPLDMDRARRALTLCQDHFHLLEQQFASDLMAYGHLRELARLGRIRKGEWKSWSDLIRETIEQCSEPLGVASKALASCWHELAERGGMTSISVQATGVTQEFETGLHDYKQEQEERELHGGVP